MADISRLSTERKAINSASSFLSSQAISAKNIVHSELQHLFREKSVSRKRRKILNEIYQTERSYLHHLTLLTTLFLDPIKVSMVLPTKVVDGIFSNIEAIQSVSANLLEQMEEHGVVCALLKLAPYMKLYSLYANNFENAERLLTEWQNKSADFARLLQFQESLEEMQNLRMRALLITPVQRVPRYRLLLFSLLEQTPAFDPDHLKLKEAYNEISKVATHINECIRQHENFQKMLAIQNSFSGDNAPKVLAPGRLFLKEGPVIKITDRGSSKERTLFLFNDILILAKKESSCLFQCRDIYPLVECLIEQVMGNSLGGGNLFKIICKEKSILFCSQHGKNNWVSDIKTAISELHANLASLQREEHVTPSIKYIAQKGKRKPLTPLKMLKCSSSSSIQISSRQKKHNRQNSFTNNHTKQIASLCNHYHNSSMGIENHNFQSLLSDSSFFRSHSMSENKNELAANPNLFTEDEVFISTRLSSVSSTNTRFNSVSSKSADSCRSSISRHNWSVTEPKPIECRPSIHSDDKCGKIGCSSMKRMLRQNQQRSIYDKKVTNETKGVNSPTVKVENREPKETPGKVGSNSCAMM